MTVVRVVIKLKDGYRTPFAPPLPFRLLLRVPLLRNIPSRIVAFGFWPVRVKE